MTKSKHTPGEWSYGVRRDGTIWLSIGDPKQPGAAHHQGEFCGTEADARLTVSAPKLLEALKRAVQALDDLTEKVDRTGFSESDEFARALDEISLGRTAIAKATQE